MLRLLVRILAVIGAMTVVLVGLVVAAAITSRPSVPSRAVLTVDFRRGMVEHVPENAISRLAFKKELTTRAALDALERAAEDGRVVGLMARVDEAPIGLAQMQEIREAVLVFRKSGKPSVAFAETMGGLTPANGACYLASAFGRVVVQPSGSVGLIGLSADVPFVREGLGKLGLEARFSRREAYKTGANIFTEPGFTDEHRAETEMLLSARFAQIVRGIADARAMTADSVHALVDRGPLTAVEARAAGLIDAVGYVDEVRAELFDEDAEAVSLAEYADRTAAGGGGKGVALIYGVGMIVSGRSQEDPVLGEASVGSDTVVGAFEAARKSKDVAAVVFRLDSPGGSYTASDAVWRAVKQTSEAGKPVVVSMGNLAASGAYLASTHADRVLAEPGTITGSIGVFGGKFLTTGLWKKLGIAWESASVGEHARLGSSLEDFTSEGKALFERDLDRVYAEFTGRVAEGRKLTPAAVQAVAGGRVWMGEEALAKGLVDELGGLKEAVARARAAAGLGEDAPVRVFPPERSLLELIVEEGLEGASSSSSTETLLRIRHLLGPLARLARLVTGPSGPMALHVVGTEG